MENLSASMPTLLGTNSGLTEDDIRRIQETLRDCSTDNTRDSYRSAWR